ncbi:MAG: acylphosphatase [Methylococcaceae bacterium]|nr:acylphosphatase [Methylococcaceae bacterium]MDD1615890.1 acylphosphatase [Methylococcaceae bacterium]OYV19158.1 MAG: acylphosphatase [Methylococcaceae bacterium NSP1-2]
MRRVKILVAGRVQGVYFRYFTKNKADELGVMGSVKNLDSGHVEIIAEADDATLEKFIHWCHKGPITARVDSVEISELQCDAPLTAFVRN